MDLLIFSCFPALLPTSLAKTPSKLLPTSLSLFIPAVPAPPPARKPLAIPELLTVYLSLFASTVLILTLLLELPPILELLPAYSSSSVFAALALTPAYLSLSASAILVSAIISTFLPFF